MKKTAIFIFCVALLAGCNTQKTANLPLSLTWEMGANGIQPGYYENTFYLVNTGETVLDGNWVIYFNQISAGNALHTDEAPLAVERVQSTLFKMYPSKQYQSLAAGDTLKFTFR
ncbi:hypothetical protein FACS189446_2780 [Bacteroidia bacterium]|nr:hypothetical protein FACS189446_2780 [Bacteroidia bacterium]